MSERTIHVNFVMMNGDNLEIEVPDNMIVEDALEQLVEAGVTEPLGHLESWALCFKESGKTIDIEKSMAENGITEGMAVRVDRDGQAG